MGIFKKKQKLLDEIFSKFSLKNEKAILKQLINDLSESKIIIKKLKKAYSIDKNNELIYDYIGYYHEMMNSIYYAIRVQNKLIITLEKLNKSNTLNIYLYKRNIDEYERSLDGYLYIINSYKILINYRIHIIYNINFCFIIIFKNI